MWTAPHRRSIRSRSRPSSPSPVSRSCAAVGSDFPCGGAGGFFKCHVGSQRVASNLAFGNFSTYYCFAEGFRTVSLINAGSGRTLLLRKTVPMSYGEQLTFVIVNNASTGALELVRVNDTACSGQMGGFGCLRMANFLLGGYRSGFADSGWSGAVFRCAL